MTTSIYIETSVVSYLTARQSKDLITAAHQLITANFWETLSAHKACICELVLIEAGQGDAEAAKRRLAVLEGLTILEINEDCRKLAQCLIDKSAIPTCYPEDALHIAVAAVHEMDVIVTWNFKHINNPMTRNKIRRIIEKSGYIYCEICSPEEFMGVNDD